MTIAEDEVAYKLGPEVVLEESGSEESSEGPAAPEPTLPDHVPISAPAPVPLAFRKPGELPPHGLRMKVPPRESNPGGTSTPPLGSLRNTLFRKSGPKYPPSRTSTGSWNTSPGSQQGTGELQCLKHSPRIGQRDGSVQGGGAGE